VLIPGIVGVIRRRILVNFRVDPEVMQRFLPARFRPKLVPDGAALAGVCLIRLEQLRPRPLPALLGLSSENAAHRIAVRWTTPEGVAREGVYIPRRDSDSRLARVVGGRLFPGEHHPAAFQVMDDGSDIDFSMRSRDGDVAVTLRGKAASALPPSSRFRSLREASEFFEQGSLGYSDTADRHRLDGLRLVTKDWRVTPLDVAHVRSSLFDDPALFPPGSVDFDCALVMRDIEHEWQAAEDLQLPDDVRAPLCPRG
jgi:Uncharacterized conserved protein (COG2071)